METMFFIKCLGYFLFWNLAASNEIQTHGEWFEYCDHLVPLGPDRSIYINSPRYPKKYTPNSSCRYTITAPLDYEINLQCNIDFDKGPVNCTTEYFYISIEGHRDLHHGQYFCGKGYIQRKSYFRSLVMAYTSSSENAGGSFSCVLETQPQPCECGWTIFKDTNKINRGEEVESHEYPMLAGLVNLNSGRLFCGGTIISHRYVMTAASCFTVYTTSKDVLVRVGEQNLNRDNETPASGTHSVTSITLHPMYNAEKRINDIALVMTRTNIEWSLDVGPACLPFYFSFNPFTESKAEMIGWGTTKFMGPPADVVRKVSVNVTTSNYCKSVYSDLDDSQICTYSPPKDACLFDAGTPLLVGDERLYAIGVTGITSSCGLFLPSVHTRVTSHLNWISLVVGQGLCWK